MKRLRLPKSKSSSSKSVRLKPAAAKEAETAVSRSSFSVRLRRRTANNIQRQIAATAKPTSTNTPATAPVFLKNVVPPEDPLLGLNVGFAKMDVCVTKDPSLPVEVNICVTIAGAIVMVSFWLLVVVMKSVVFRVALGRVNTLLSELGLLVGLADVLEGVFEDEAESELETRVDEDEDEDVGVLELSRVLLEGLVEGGWLVDDALEGLPVDEGRDEDVSEDEEALMVVDIAEVEAGIEVEVSVEPAEVIPTLERREADVRVGADDVGIESDDICAGDEVDFNIIESVVGLVDGVGLLGEVELEVTDGCKVDDMDDDAVLFLELEGDEIGPVRVAGVCKAREKDAGRVVDV